MWLSLAEWLELVTLVHVPQKTGGSSNPGSGWVAKTEFSSGVYPTVSQLLVH